MSRNLMSAIFSIALVPQIAQTFIAPKTENRHIKKKTDHRIDSVGDLNDFTVNDSIVIDQFGYLPDAKKIAVLRSPKIGFDSDKTYSPGDKISLVNISTGNIIYRSSPIVWKKGKVDASSGDRVWWFDFSKVTTAGEYAVIDIDRKIRSPNFKISPHIYKKILNVALRTFYYQRSGFAKDLPYAEPGWTDKASHLGPQQDRNARIFNDKGNANTEKDLSGGWHDAGDYNKYTASAADNIILLLQAYEENPSAWTDDINIPESGNGIPDILDEVTWGLDWLKKMQDATADYSVLSIVGQDSASPPSAANGPSYYGLASTNATIGTAAAFAFAGKVFRDTNLPRLGRFADDLIDRAEKAWDWTQKNPRVFFYNNDEKLQPGSANLGYGQQETDIETLEVKKRIAAIFLYSASSKKVYKEYFENEYSKVTLKKFVDSFREFENSVLLYYSKLPKITPRVSNDIRNWYRKNMKSRDNWAAMTQKRDPYIAYINTYVWGSNSSKAAKGSMFMELVAHDIKGFDKKVAKNYALSYLNYLHGLNPLGIVYLSNMYSLGATKSVNEIYHDWFIDGSPTWDRVGVSTYGPPPGFLTGGPNPHYNWSEYCDENKPSTICGLAPPSPPAKQPPQKSYLDFNTKFPYNSYSVSENSCSYQATYLRLLSKFVN